MSGKNIKKSMESAANVWEMDGAGDHWIKVHKPAQKDVAISTDKSGSVAHHLTLLLAGIVTLYGFATKEAPQEERAILAKALTNTLAAALKEEDKS